MHDMILNTVFSKERWEGVNSVGKIYVCSDIHSHMDVLEEALSDLKDDDVLYIIGDAVDKGPDGLQPLLKIMEDPRCRMLMGNHDLMMLQYLSCLNHEDKVRESDMNEIRRTWLQLNGGLDTLRSYVLLDADKQQEVLHFLESLPLAVNVETEEDKFLLVHAAVPQEYEDLDGTVPLDVIRDEEYPFLYDWKNDFVWSRNIKLVADKVIISGHTFVQNYGTDEIVAAGDFHWFDIDCGMALNNEHSRLAVVCLNTMEIQYYFPKTGE